MEVDEAALSFASESTFETAAERGMFTVILNTIVGYPIPVVQGKPFLQGNLGIYAAMQMRIQYSRQERALVACDGPRSELNLVSWLQFQPDSNTYEGGFHIIEIVRFHALMR